jgi:hypothetical protein
MYDEKFLTVLVPINNKYRYREMNETVNPILFKF